MKPLPVNLLSWSAWAPGADDGSEAVAVLGREDAIPVDRATPDVSFLPAMLRRRLSRLDRIVLHTAHACIADRDATACRVVLASRHGELVRTQALLLQLARDEALSPGDFSLSVHNAPAGLFSMWAGNHEPAVAIAAGPETVAAGLLDALCQAAAEPAAPVIFIYADEAMPTVYAPYVETPGLTGAVGMLLGAAPDHGRALTWEYVDGGGAGPGLPVAALASWLAGDDRDLALDLGGQTLWLAWGAGP